MRSLFGDAADQWEWEPHVSAAPLAVPEKAGEARVEVVEGKRPERLARTAGLLRELGIGRRQMTCGVLVRSNTLVREVADFLRSEGFDVIEEGRREPAKDHPLGVTVWHLLKWLANPADGFARRVLEMSPLQGLLESRFGTEPWKIWDGLTGCAARSGFATMVEEAVAPLWSGLSAFGRQRAGDLISALEEFEASGGATARDAADWVGRLEISQTPGLAAVQVMTIHKSKGLGFDVVVLPELPNDEVPQAQFFDVAAGGDWISETPPKWARALLPEMRNAEEIWGTAQRYEALCALYVALTRAKRGLYVLLEPPSATQKEEKASLANFLATSLESDGTPGIIHQDGDPSWSARMPATDADRPPEDPHFPLGSAVPRRGRLSPSRHSSGEAPVLRSNAPAAFGRKVHAVFESVGWLDEEAFVPPSDDAGALVGRLLVQPDLRALFERRGRDIRLMREQPLDAVVDGKWLSGIIDRLHLHLDHSGAVIRIEVIDFKTDAVAQASELLERHAPQMEAYRNALGLAYPGVEIECHLISTALRTSVPV
jgi:ATP-dependent helicase/nuclease subunit A